MGWEWRWLSWAEGLKGARGLGRAWTEGKAGDEPELDAARPLVLSPVAVPATLLLALWARGCGAAVAWAPSASMPPGGRRLVWSAAPRRAGEVATLAWPAAPGHPGAGDGDPPTEWRPRVLEAPTAVRDVAFFAGSLAASAAWGFLDGAIDSGAALALEPAKTAAAGSAAWVGPTVLWLDHELDRQFAGLRDTRRERRRGVLRNLRAVVAESLPAAAIERWRALGLPVAVRDERP